ncbi:LysE family transporter [Winogradskya consettensis]|uniref:Lysine transporter LysE n=1 Tax=Winogradskya consettensis TaxID=113560 RepID=A0A919W069_9ACTN|nr:LysE family transporter [Actinoplanes consettensis]GIM81138.1 lysine transporter LysE [Actinoplanes consettensis]
MIGSLWSGVIAGYGVAVPVGAIGILIAGLSARTSFKVGAAAGLGAATADGIYAALAVLGGAALAGAITPIATPLRWLAAAALLALATHTTFSALHPGTTVRETKQTTALGAYLAILALTLLNPMTIVYFAALVLGRGSEGGGIWFVLGALIASASWQLFIAASGALAGRLLTTPRARRLTALISSAVIAVLAINLVT